MEFDEYDYLEKTVEEDGGEKKKKSSKNSAEKTDKSYRKREDVDEDDKYYDEDERRRSKRSRGDRDEDREDDENGERREKEKSSSRHRDRDRDRERERSSRDRRERSRSRDRDRERRERDRERERERERRERSKSRRSRTRSPSREVSRSRRSRSRERSRSRRYESDRDRERERERERELRERERELEMRESRRSKEKKEAVEPEADPERDQRTVFAYQMPLKANERDVYEFFSRAGKVRDVRLIMDRNSRRSKGVGYIEFYDVMSVPMAIALSGQLLLGQPVMVKPSEAEKNLVQSTTTGTSTTGAYGATDRKLYVGNLHFSITEAQLRQIFEPFGPVELVQLPLDPETGQCKGFGFVQFAQLEHAKAAQSLNGKLEIAGRLIKISSVTDHVGGQDTTVKAADLDDDEGGGLSLNAQSRALLMQKLDRSGITTSMGGPLGVTGVNGTATTQPVLPAPLTTQAAIPAPVLPGQVVPQVAEPVGNPSDCLLLKNMFDPASETEPDFDLDIKEDVEEECSKYGRVKHIYVDKFSAGCVYLRFDSVDAAVKAQHAMHMRWFARRLISALFMQPHEYEAKFKDAA